MPALDPHHWARRPQATAADRHGLGVLDDDACLRLLDSRPIGRLGFTAGALPVVLPVNHVVVGRSILFRSEPGEKLRAALHHDVACFEVDDVDPLGHGGWSVLATGRLEVVAHEEAADLADVPLVPWGLSGQGSLVRLPVALLSGRVFGHD